VEEVRDRLRHHGSAGGTQEHDAIAVSIEYESDVEGAAR
jgi:hypothetical protein